MFEKQRKIKHSIMPMTIQETWGKKPITEVPSVQFATLNILSRYIAFASTRRCSIQLSGLIIDDRVSIRLSMPCCIVVGLDGAAR